MTSTSDSRSGFPSAPLSGGKTGVGLLVKNLLIVHASEHLQDQRQLAMDNPDNPLLQVRGNAGTHDIELGRATLEALTSATEHHSEVLHT